MQQQPTQIPQIVFPQPAITSRVAPRPVQQPTFAQSPPSSNWRPVVRQPVPQTRTRPNSVGVPQSSFNTGGVRSISTNSGSRSMTRTTTGSSVGGGSRTFSSGGSSRTTNNGGSRSSGRSNVQNNQFGQGDQFSGGGSEFTTDGRSERPRAPQFIENRDGLELNNAVSLNGGGFIEDGVRNQAVKREQVSPIVANYNEQARRVQQKEPEIFGQRRTNAAQVQQMKTPINQQNQEIEYEYEK